MGASLPSRERGLKYRWPNRIVEGPQVAPFAGAWIEITPQRMKRSIRSSLPSRERGLKFVEARFKVTVDFVAPFAGAWIEIISLKISSSSLRGRSLRGSVD